MEGFVVWAQRLHPRADNLFAVALEAVVGGKRSFREGVNVIVVGIVQVQLSASLIFAHRGGLSPLVVPVGAHDLELVGLHARRVRNFVAHGGSARGG